MKFSEFITEDNKESKLLGKTIQGVKIMPDVRKKIWNKDFNCSYHNLTSLEGSPKEITGYFYCYNNSLKSLANGPEIVDGDFMCYGNKLSSLVGGPKEVGGFFVCSENNLTSLKGAPKIINNNFVCSKNKLPSLKDIHKIFTKLNGSFICNNNRIKSHVLGLLLIPGIEEVDSGAEWGRIINRYLGRGRAGLIDCQNELIEAGLEEYAQL